MRLNIWHYMQLFFLTYIFVCKIFVERVQARIFHPEVILVSLLLGKGGQGGGARNHHHYFFLFYLLEKLWYVYLI